MSVELWMTWTQAKIVTAAPPSVAAMVGLAGLAVTVIVLFLKLAHRIGGIELKVNTMWDFTIRRGEAELVLAGLGTKHSQVVLNVETLDKIMPFIIEIIVFYGVQMKQKSPPNERDLYILIEQQFGDRIVDTICIPNKITVAGCLVAVMAACKVAYKKEDSAPA
jgi:hypothetical protein